MDSTADRLTGQWLDERHYNRRIDNTATVLKPDGSPLLIYINALPRVVCAATFDAYKNARPHSDNRAMGGPRFRRRKRDGTRSRTNQAPHQPTSILGFFEREPRTPYCRQTAFTRQHAAAFAGIQPFVRAVSKTFQAYAPERWAVQRRFVEDLSQDFVIPGTVFTTMTFNQTFRTRAHRDKNDLRAGFGVMAVLEGGDYRGGELIFPKFRTAVDMRTGGVCLADVHELHGNAPFIGLPGRFKRLSFVFYVREKMTVCGTIAEELQHALGDDDREMERLQQDAARAQAWATKTQRWAERAAAAVRRLDDE